MPRHPLSPARDLGPAATLLLESLPQGGELVLERTGRDRYAFRSLRVGATTCYGFDASLPAFLPPLAKADTPVPDGARWITVHPNGDGSKGVPVLVQEETKGKGIWHVIGGAGGNLNYLKIRGVKSEAAYKQEAADRSGAKKAEKKAQAAKDKEAGLTDDKRQARVKLKSQVLDAERKFVQTVADAQGWDKAETSPALTASLTRRHQIC